MLPTPAASASTAPRGIAVLPFENLAGPDHAYFAAGVTEEVTLQIAKVSALRVMSRPAVARFKDPMAELPAMARDLGVGAVLTGSVRHAEDRVRVGVQLLAAPSGETLWTEQFDRNVKNVLDVQTAVPVLQSGELPALPSGGLKSAREAARRPGAGILAPDVPADSDTADVALTADFSTVAIVRTAVRRNLYRAPLP